MPWTYDEVIDLCARMERKAAKGFAVGARTATLVVTALRHYAREHMGDRPAGYRIDVWDPKGLRVESH